MFIDVFKNNGTEYLRLAESRRITNEKGRKVTSKKIILNLMKKNKFVLPIENKMKNNKSNNNLKKFNNKKISSPFISNRNSGYLNNNKFKHKKLASYK